MFHQGQEILPCSLGFFITGKLTRMWKEDLASFLGLRCLWSTKRYISVALKKKILTLFVLAEKSAVIGIGLKSLTLKKPLLYLFVRFCDRNWIKTRIERFVLLPYKKHLIYLFERLEWCDKDCIKKRNFEINLCFICLSGSECCDRDWSVSRIEKFVLIKTLHSDTLLP